MLWVGGGILLHGLDEMNIAAVIPHAVHDFAHSVAAGMGALGSTVEWLINALGGALAGLVIGGVIVVIVRQFTKHPEELIVD
jgi:predicted DNA repair protein MutK